MHAFACALSLSLLYSLALFLSLSLSLQLLAVSFKVYWDSECVCVNALGFVCGLSEEFSLFYLTRG